jgi:hypothetical protein
MNRKETPSLGTAQLFLEEATAKLKSAQAAFLRAEAALEEANKAHTKATENLESLIRNIRGNNKVSSVFV